MANPLTLQPAEETAYQKQLLVLVRVPGHGVVAAVCIPAHADTELDA